MAISTHTESLRNCSPKKGKNKRPLWKQILIRTIFILTGLTVFTGVIIGIILYSVFTPEKITPVILNFTNEILEVVLDCKSVELTFFSTFPNLRIMLKNRICNNLLLDNVSGKILIRNQSIQISGVHLDSEAGSRLFIKRRIPRCFTFLDK